VRLCFAANPGSVHVQRWLQWFAARGHDVSLVAFGGNDPVPGVTTVAHRRFPSARGTVRLPVVLWARKHLAAARPDVVHAQWLPWSGWCAALARQGPVVITPWGSDMLVLAEHRREIRALNRAALRRADLVTWDSTALRDACLRAGVSPNHLARVHFGVDLARFASAPRDNALRARLRLAEADIVMLSPRTPAYKSNVDVVVRAFGAVTREVPSARLVVRCDDPAERDSLEALAGSLGAAASLRFVGRLPEAELPALYALADITISVPPSDSAPVSIGEAMASGSVPIVSALPWVDEWFAGGGADVVAVGDVDALASAMYASAVEPDRRERMRRRNLEVVARLADRDREMARMELFYERLAGREPAGSAS